MAKQAKRKKAWTGDTAATHALDAATRIIEGSARAMGLQVVD